MESQPQNPEFRNNPANFLPCQNVKQFESGSKLFAKVINRQQKSTLDLARKELHLTRCVCKTIQ